MTTLDIDDLQITTFKGKHNSKGSWSVQIDFGVKMVHLPTGYIVECGDFRSQHKNRTVCIEALKELLEECNVEEQVSRWLYEGG